MRDKNLSFKRWLRKNKYKSTKNLVRKENLSLRDLYEEYLENYGAELVIASNHYVDIYKIIEELEKLPSVVTWREIAPIFVFGDNGYRRGDFKTWYKVILDFTKKGDVKKLVKEMKHYQANLIAGEAWHGMTWWSLSNNYENILGRCQLPAD